MLVVVGGFRNNQHLISSRRARMTSCYGTLTRALTAAEHLDDSRDERILP